MKGQAMWRWAIAAVIWASAAQGAPLYPNSVVSNDIDFIRTSDPSAFGCLAYLGTDRREMPDKRGGPLFQEGVHVFDARFQDGTTVEIWVTAKLGGRAAAEHVALQASGPLGRLPTMARAPLRHVVIHDGDETAFAEDQGRFFALYAGNMAKRIRTHDLEETTFHEAMHASLQIDHLRKPAWRRAVQADNAYVTRYASTQPQEDFAEHALFAYTYLRTPERLPADVRAAIPQIMPNRLAYFAKLFPSTDQTFQRVGPYGGCG
jgi:hypothetical protein